MFSRTKIILRSVCSRFSTDALVGFGYKVQVGCFTLPRLAHKNSFHFAQGTSTPRVLIGLNHRLRFPSQFQMVQKRSFANHRLFCYVRLLNV